MPTAVESALSPLHALIAKLLKKQAVQPKKPERPAKVALRAGMTLREESRGSERRRTSRRSYSHWQIMASFDGKKEPPQSDFRLVLCHDVSPTGFSFFCEKPPRQKRLIIALGTAPFTFFEAEIVRREQQLNDPAAGWLLGCRFLRRLSPEEANEEFAEA